MTVLGLGAFTTLLPAARTGRANAADPLARPHNTAGSTGLVFDPLFLEPIFRPPHPEVPRRVEAIMQELQRSGVRQQLAELQALPVTDDTLQLIHTPEHIAGISRDARVERIARTAVGATVAALSAVMQGAVRNAFVCVRPPGHHARNDGREEGFCFYNNVAIAARAAQKSFGIERVLIVDWDYHHGDGTEYFFYDDPGVAYFSTHDWHAYPGTGDPARRGADKAPAFNINVPLTCGATDADIRRAFIELLVPVADQFQPQLVLISAGFDSRAEDLLGCFAISDNGFAELTKIVMDLAARHAQNRVVSVLEGGYYTQGLATAARTHVQTLLTHQTR